MSEDEVRTTLERMVSGYSPTLSYGEVELVGTEEIVSFQIEETVQQVMVIGENDWREFLHVLRDGEELEMKIVIDENELSDYIEGLKGMIEIVGTPNSLELEWGEVKVTNGEDGIKLDDNRLRDDLARHARLLMSESVEIRIRETRNMLRENEIEELTEVVERLVGDRMTIKIDEARAVLNDHELVSFLSTAPDSLGAIQVEAIESYVLGLAERYDREPQDAVFQFADGAVQEFAPAKDGIAVSLQDSVVSLQGGIRKLLEDGVEIVEIEIVVERTSPKITTKEVNDLGIVERIGRGESYYAHSIPNRVYNVGLASRRVNGALIAPGEEFSFNKQMGEISRVTGYRTAYVISNGRTELGDGGGVCQVSTTMFRTAMNAGLPITERWAHAYRVGYYEQNSEPGFDATIYSPSKDLKFLNDTSGHILVQMILDEPNRHLVFELYGTDDGRVALISPARVWGVTPPPPDLYQDDPTLAVGVIKQVDWSAWGGKAAFDYRVEKDGETITSETYVSNFRPWQNVFLRGTGE